MDLYIDFADEEIIILMLVVPFTLLGINGIARASEEVIAKISLKNCCNIFSIMSQELTRSVGSTSGKMIHSFFHDPSNN